MKEKGGLKPLGKEEENGMKKAKWLKRLCSLVLTIAMVLAMLPISNLITKASEPDTRVADPSTKDSYKEVFGIESDTISTENAGRVWTDKSVFTEIPEEFKGLSLKAGNESFLVSLSAMASTTSITGMATVPTDTMLILDLSSSMYGGGDKTPTTVQTMVDAVNKTIQTLQKANKLNRVGVTIYFGGENLLNSTSTASSSKVLLPLNRYTHNNNPDSNAFLKANVSSGKLTGIEVNSNVTIEGTTTAVAKNTHNVPDIAGTYAQLGILDAMNQFLGVKDTTVTVANGEQTRVPIFVFMSDGEPTAATNEFSKKTVSKMGNNRVASRNPNETDFVTQLTAAYAKKMVDDHYVDSTPLFYTLSLKTTTVSEEVMDPSNHTTTQINNYWSDLVKNGSVNITVQNITSSWDKNQTESKTYTVSKVSGFPSSVEQRKYVDKAFTAETAGELNNVFQSIVQEIDYQSKYFPTFVEGNEDVEGYVSFVDTIGEYMNVTDIKGLYIGGEFYSGKTLSENFVSGGGLLGTKEAPTALGDELVWSIATRIGVSNEVARTLLGLAYQNGQLSYTSASVFSNYVGWYSDAAGNYLGFWHEESETAPAGATHINRSYLFLGAVDADEGVEASDMMYATIRVRNEIATGNETVAFAVPAALIPVVHYEVDLNENGEVEALERTGAQHPIRLVYEVTLDDSVNNLTVHDPNVVDPEYVAAHTGIEKEADGTEKEVVYFYSNNYEVDNSTGYGKVNTYSYFRPSHENEKYYYQADATVYADENGTEYKGDAQPSGEKYISYIVYEKSGNQPAESKVVYRELSDSALATAVKKADGTWYIPDGNVHVNMDGFGLVKSANNTATLPNADEPFVDVHGHNVNDANHSFVVGATLGNNGRLYLEPATGMAITKTVDEVNADEDANHEFTFTISNADAAGVDFDAAKIVDGKEVELEGTSFDKDGVAVVKLLAGETVYIYNIPAGTYEVTEGENEYYIQTSVTGTVSDEVTLKAGEISNIEFTNTARGEGDLTITKQISHNLGTDYQIPDKTFNMTVTLTGAGTANKEFKAVHSGNEEITSVTTDENGVFTLALKHNEQITVKGLP